ncbi:MAG TPA: succinate dehydrogenase, cytochrome b556 subunit [Sphingomicrobium sp.]
MAAKRPRPLSPHLTIWRWGPAMAVSILHRITGAGLSILGLALLTWWLLSTAGAGEDYTLFTDIMSSIFGKIILIGLTWAFFQHLLSGIRHLAMDSGAAFELGINKTTAILTIIGSLLLTAVLWAYLLGVFK